MAIHTCVTIMQTNHSHVIPQQQTWTLQNDQVTSTSHSRYFPPQIPTEKLTQTHAHSDRHFALWFSHATCSKKRSCSLHITGTSLWSTDTLPGDQPCRSTHTRTHARTHTHTHLFNGPLSRTTRVGRYQKGKTNLDFTEARHTHTPV